MKKSIYLILILFLVGITKMNAQFTASGSNLVHSGNGTTLTITPESNSAGSHISSGQALNLIFNDNNVGNDYFTIRANGNTLNSSSEFFRINHLGNIGIGTPTPVSKLEVNGDISLVRTKKIKFLEVVGGGDRAYIRSTNGQNGEDYNSLIFAVGGGSETMFLNAIGNVGIGTSDTKGFKLGVKGKIAAEEVKVALHSTWSDFVFYDDYKLPTLKEVENHIKEKGHLKDIPSAEEVKENGVFLGEMDSKLLQKIEELTLYTIAQEKKINEQNSKLIKQEQEIVKLKSLNKKLLELQKRLEKLENK